MSADSVYPSFLALLSSPQDPSNSAVAESTLFPAIGHYLATLPRSSLPAFTSTVISSPYLWPPTEPPSVASLRSLEDAVQASVGARVISSPRPSVTEGLLGMIWRRTTDRPLAMDDWVRLVLNAALDDKTGDKLNSQHADMPRLAVLAGLYEGVVKVGSVVSDRTRRDVEVELLVAFDDAFTKLDKGKGKEQTRDEVSLGHALPLVYHPAARVFPLVPMRSLRALDLRSISARSVNLLPSSPESTPPSSDELVSLVTVLSISLEGIAGSRLVSSAPLVEEVVAMLDTFSRHMLVVTSADTADVCIQSYLLPLSATVVDLFLTLPRLLDPALCTTLLLVWFRLAPHTARLGGLEGLDGYGRMWWGLLDCWLAYGKDRNRVVEGTRRLEDELGPSPQEAPDKLDYYLMVVEQVLGVFPMGKLGDKVVQELIVDVCEPHLEDNSNLAVFESAHSVMLALMTLPDRRDAAAIASSSPSLLGRIAVDYSDKIIRAADSALLTDAQLQHALSLLLPLLLSISPALPLSLLYKLHERSSTSGKTLRSFASLLPSVPVALLPRYLAQLEDVLFAATEPRSEGRAEVVAIIWDGVGGSGKLADEAREAVSRWWEEVRERLQAEERNGGGRKREAKL